MMKRVVYAVLAVLGLAVTVSPASAALHVDVTQGGTFCLASASNVMLWRPDASAPVRFTIAGPGGTRTLNWAAGEPNHANGQELFVEMFGDGVWNDNQNLDQTFPTTGYFVEYEPIVVIVQTP